MTHQPTENQEPAPAPETTEAIAVQPTVEPEPAEVKPAIVMTPASIQDVQGVAVFSSQDAFVAAQRMAKALAASTLVPAQYQGINNIPNVLIAMEMAHRIDASVFMVMQNLDIIHGRPSFRATFLIGTVNASGKFTPLRYRWEGQPGKPTWGCRAVAKDRETDEECVGALITIAMAQAEGWVSKKGSKWQTMPEQMLMYRAAAFWTRIFAPEFTLGMHTTDEIEDAYPRVTVQRGQAGALGQSSLAQKLAEQREPDSDDAVADESDAPRDEGDRS